MPDMDQQHTSTQPRRHLSLDGVQKHVQAASLADLTVAELVALFGRETAVKQHAPDGRFQQDPRDGALVLYNEARNRRPHDNKPDAPDTAAARPCPICNGDTTGIVDVAALSQGVTFINKNLYPPFIRQRQMVALPACTSCNGRHRTTTTTGIICPMQTG